MDRLVCHALPMAKKDRSDIPSATADAAMFLSDRTCCVCRAPDKAVQIHHIDENPANHDPANLAVLCLHCHQKTQLRGGFDRKLNAGQIKLYRDDWHAVVVTRRAATTDVAPVRAVRRGYVGSGGAKANLSNARFGKALDIGIENKDAGSEVDASHATFATEDDDANDELA